MFCCIQYLPTIEGVDSYVYILDIPLGILYPSVTISSVDTLERIGVSGYNLKVSLIHIVV